MTDESRIDVCNKEIRRLETDIKGLRELINEQFRSRDEALKVAVTAMEKRLTTMNEFRGAMEDLGNRAISREEYQNAHALLSDRLALVERKLAGWDGRLSGFSAALLIINGLVSWYISHH